MIEAARSSGDHDLLARLSRHVAWYEAARAFGRIVSQRGGAESVHHAGAHIPLPLLRHAQDAPGHARERPGDLSRRVWHVDELFEILTLRQTQKAPPIPIVLFDRTYWQRVINFEALAAEAMIDRNNLELFDYAESAEEVWQMLVRRGLRAHTPDGGSA
jgi:predicted Rossmann-fold nucleotide-binding protein